MIEEDKDATIKKLQDRIKYLQEVARVYQKSAMSWMKEYDNLLTKVYGPLHLEIYKNTGELNE